MIQPGSSHLEQTFSAQNQNRKWIYSIYAIALAGSLSLVFRFQLKKQSAKSKEKFAEGAKELKQKRRELEQEREITKELQATDQMKNQFLINTSHELRTPLNGIIGLTQSLIDEKKGTLPQAVKQDLKLVTNSGKRLFLLINDIMDLVQLEQKNVRLEKKPLNLREIVEICIKTQIPVFMEKKLEWRNSIPEDITVFADPDRLQQIIQNLLGNALKFTFEGMIHLSAVKKGEFAEIVVRDTGIGIIEENLSQLFDHFIQKKRSCDDDGFGLGIQITKSLVEKHGGSIWAESKVNSGSSFYFTLPLSDQQTTSIDNTVPAVSIQNDEEESSTSAGMTNESSHKILIVDDDPVSLKALINQLDIGEFSLQKATDGIEALDAIEREKPDLVLMDIMMDKMSGIEACKMIRKQYSKLELPIIFQTCKDTDIDLKKALEAGGNDYITKPFSGVEVISRIHNHLSLSNESRQLPQPIVEIISKMNNIVYITSSHDYACLYGYENQKSMGEYYITLKKVSDYLGEQFIKVNRSTLVKMSEIQSVRMKNRKILITFKRGFSEEFECTLTKGNIKTFKQNFPHLI